MDSPAPDPPLSAAAIARRLASSSPSARLRAVRALSSFLSSSAAAADDAAAAVSDADLFKIWKGLFYCFWHADKPPAQSDLATCVASLLSSPPAQSDLAARFFSAFLLTLRREWPGIDFLRLDKFYLLNRRFLHHLFLLLRTRRWDPDLSSRMISVLSDTSLLPVDNHPANGVGYHIAEAFLEELGDFLPVGPETLDLLLKPFFSVFQKSSDKVLVNKIKLNLFERLLQNGAKLLSLTTAGEQVEPKSDVERFGRIALSVGFSKRFFELGSAPETLQANRKVLFGLHESFLKLEKDLEKSGVCISIEIPENGDSEKVPESSAAENGGEGSDEKPSKKRKKLKKASDGDDKKLNAKKKKKKKKSKSLNSMDFVAEDSVAEQSNNEAANIEASGTENNEKPNEDPMESGNLITFDEAVISNLQKQFEKAAAEAGMVNGNVKPSTPQTTPVNGAVVKKRKRAKSADGKAIANGTDASGGNTVGKSGDKSVKKVRFSMKSNLVWKPHSPLPPQSLRLPPSATPRGSALKKGVAPGPIKETPSVSKMKKGKAKASSAKKNRMGSKSPSSAVKRLRKLQSLSV
uniref:Ribosomal RNA processing protein 1 homolog n=1 Tax=Ananas comosus var. bracteatus TaxID=296719 RepID=A0A6V7P5V1_ANACO|nr:unnamed protein product [Ananas comosus var. bracteatus]